MAGASVIVTNFSYILIIIVCTSMATLYIRRVVNKGEPIYKAVSSLTGAMLLYAVFEMFAASMYLTFLSDEGRFWLVTASDLAFFAIIVSWVEMLIFLSGNPYTIKPKGIIVYTVIYAVIVDTFAFISGRIAVVQYSFILDNMILICNMIFDITYFIIGLVFFKYALTAMREEKHRGIMMSFSLVLSIFMLYIIYWDICSGTVDRENYLKYQDFDFIFIIYILVGLFIILMASRNTGHVLGFDISKTIALEQTEETDWEEISNKYKLTMREIEVAQLVSLGISNPDIGNRLFISESTVKHHLGSIYKKMDIKGRFELINILKS